MKANVRLAFEVASDGFSPDRVVADPALDSQFLSECRRLGLVESDEALNRALLNLRKGGQLRGLKSRRSAFPDEDQYRFASEMAARFLERRDGVTVDDIICSPSLGAELDELAARIAPGFTPLQYRWAALNLRKARRLKPEIASHLVKAEAVSTIRVPNINADEVPSCAGLYVFFTRNRVLYVGEAENLNNRIRKHLDHSDNRGLARWLWDQGTDDLHLELHVLPAGLSTRARRCSRRSLFSLRKPMFNVRC